MRASKSSNQTPLIVGGIVVVLVLLTGAFWALTSDPGSEGLGDEALVEAVKGPEIPQTPHDRAQTVAPEAGPQRLERPTEVVAAPGEELVDASRDGGGTAAGRVIDAKGQPVSDAVLSVYRTNNLLAANFPGARSRVAVTTTTAPDGTFSLDGIPFHKRPYVVVAEHDDHATSESGTFLIRQGRDALDIEIVMGRGATIRGSVTAAAGVGASGPPIVNARVELYDAHSQNFARPAEQKPWRVVFTDALGRYQFDHVSSQAIRIKVVADGYETKELMRSWALQGGASDAEIDFALRTGRTLTGRVTDGDGRPIEGVDLTATSLTKEYQSTALAVSDANGYFLLEGLTDDYFQLRARCEGYSPTTRPKIHHTAGQINVVMQRQGAVEGWVTNPDGTGLTSFQLALMRHRAEGEPTYMNDIRAFRKTDKGYFLFGEVEPGEYVLEARADSWADTRSEPFTIDRATADVPAQVRIRMTAGGHLVGTVFLPDGEPAVGAEVELNENGYVDSAIGRLFGSISPSGERERRVVTGEDGTYEFTAVPPKTYQVSARHPDAAPRQIDDVRVREETVAGVTRQDIQLKPGAAIGGRALDEANRPIPFCKVQISQKGGYMEVVNTDKNGEFVFENLKPGEYTVTLSPSVLDGEKIGPFMTILYAQKSQQEIYVSEGQQLLDVQMLLVKS